jgi:hypothetical protein
MALHNRPTQVSQKYPQRKQKPSNTTFQGTPPIDLEEIDSQWPPLGDFSTETPAQREERLAHEGEAKRINDEIDAQIEIDKAERRKRRPDIKIILLGKFAHVPSLFFFFFPCMNVPFFVVLCLFFVLFCFTVSHYPFLSVSLLNRSG